MRPSGADSTLKKKTIKKKEKEKIDEETNGLNKKPEILLQLDETEMCAGLPRLDI